MPVQRNSEIFSLSRYVEAIAAIRVGMILIDYTCNFIKDFMERGFEAMNALDLHVLNAQSSTNDATKRKDMFGTMVRV